VAPAWNQTLEDVIDDDKLVWFCRTIAPKMVVVKQKGENPRDDEWWRRDLLSLARSRNGVHGATGSVHDKWIHHLWCHVKVWVPR